MTRVPWQVSGAGIRLIPPRPESGKSPTRRRKTSVQRNTHDCTIQRRQTQEAHSHHLLAFRYHPLLLQHPHLQLTCLERTCPEALPRLRV